MKLPRFTVYTVLIGLIVVYVIGSIIFPFFYPFSMRITIKEKGTYGAGKNMNAIVTDTTGKVYTVHNNLLLGDFDAISRYSALEEGKTYDVSGYGVRVALPFVQLFPNITRASPA
jgi:hypothetical protein